MSDSQDLDGCAIQRPVDDPLGKLRRALFFLGERVVLESRQVVDCFPVCLEVLVGDDVEDVEPFAVGSREVVCSLYDRVRVAFFADGSRIVIPGAIGRCLITVTLSRHAGSTRGCRGWSRSSAGRPAPRRRSG